MPKCRNVDMPKCRNAEKLKIMGKIRNIRQLIWLIRTIRKNRRITLRDLSDKWVDDKVCDGNPLPRSSFNRYRDEIFDTFGLVMSCDSEHRYYFDNPSVVDDNSIEGWLLSTMTVNAVLSDSASIRDQIILGRVMAGEQYLPTIVNALKRCRCLRIGHQKFGHEPTERTVEPYALRVCEGRWYLLVRTDGVFKKFSLDRIHSLEMTDERFEKLADFSAEAYFSEYFGVLTDDTPMAHIVLRASGATPDYLRTLPLHHSQRELGRTDAYTDFALDLRPTADFIGELLRHKNGIEVLEPAELRQKMRETLEGMLNIY